MCDFQRCFATLYNGTQIITCRHYDNSWRITDCLNGSIKKIVHFHKAMINCVGTTENEKCIFTGSNDGIISMWQKSFIKPEWFASNHNSSIISMDICGKLGLVMTSSMYSIVIRKIYNGKFVRKVKPEFISKGIPLMISHVRFSHRGYFVVLGKYIRSSSNQENCIAVFSINGEAIKMKKVQNSATTIVISENGYEFTIGGEAYSLIKYKLLTLEGHNMLNDLDETYPGTKESLNELILNSPVITALNLTIQEGCQELLIGMDTGDFDVYKYSPRLIGNKVFDTINV